MAKTDIELLNEIEAFLKEAFCISGECVFEDFVDVVKPNSDKVESAMFKLEDSRRGVFFVTISKPNQNERA